MPLVAVLSFLVIAVAAAKLTGALSVRFGQPAVFGELLAGIVLGPTGVDVLSRGAFADPAVETISTAMGSLGVILLMFVAGLETDLARLRRVGRAAGGAAVGGVVLPFAGGTLFVAALGRPWHEALFAGVVLTATSVSISAQTLLELKALRSRAGSTILGAAVIDDVLAILLLSVVVAVAPAALDAAPHGGLVPSLAALLPAPAAVSRPLIIVILMATYFVVAVTLGRRVLGWIVLRAARLPVSQPGLTAAVLLAFTYAALAEGFGQVAGITGSYLAGVLLAQTPAREEIDRGLHPLVYSLFVPLFFVGVGLQTNGRAVIGEPRLLAGLLAVAVVGKIVGCGSGAWLGGVRGRDAYRVGVGMVSRGEVGLIVLAIGLASGTLSRELFSLLVLVVLATTLLTPPLLRHAVSLGTPARAARATGIERSISGVFESVVTPQDDLVDRPNWPGAESRGLGTQPDSRSSLLAWDGLRKSA